MKSDSRISMITLGVGDLAASTGFYVKLGWRRSAASNENITFFESAGTVLGLYDRQALADDANVENSACGFEGVALAQVYGSEAEVDAAFAHAIASGATCAKKPQKVFWGGYSGYFADLDGHLWEIAHNPFVTIDENGHMKMS